MEARHWKACLQIIINASLIGALQGQTATVTGPEGGAIEAGQDAVLTCVLSSGTSSIYYWDDVTGASPVRIVSNGGTINDDAKYSNFASSPPGDELTITAATIDDEGQYRCHTYQSTSPDYTLTVEVGAIPNMAFSTDPLRAGTEFTATCDVIGSRPQLDIAWTLNDMTLDVTPVVTNPTNTNADLSNTRSEVTLTATPAMNGQDLKCTTSGHVVTSLNRETTTQLNVEYPPTSETANIVVVTTKEGNTQLRVTCQVSAVDDSVYPSNPAINMYIFYAGSKQIPSPRTDNSVLVDIPPPEQSDTATIEIVPIKEGDNFSVTCQVSAVGEGVEPANPAVTDFTIYTGSEQMRFYTSGVNYILVDVPENATDYKCSASNDLGTIESEAVNYDPGRGGLSRPKSQDSLEST